MSRSAWSGNILDVRVMKAESTSHRAFKVHVQCVSAENMSFPESVRTLAMEDVTLELEL